MAWPSGRSADGGLDRVSLPIDTGALWQCGKRVVGPDPEAALARAGADVIVSFNERFELQRDYPKYVSWLDDNLGGHARWYPVPDLTAPAFEDAEVWVDELVALLQRGQSLILHCAGGIGRAPTMATCALIQLGMPHDRAIEHIAAARPMAGAEAGSQAALIAKFADR